MTLILRESSSQPQISIFPWTRVKGLFFQMITWTVQMKSISMWMNSTPLTKRILLSTLGMVSCQVGKANIMWKVKYYLSGINNIPPILLLVALFCGFWKLLFVSQLIGGCDWQFRAWQRSRIAIAFLLNLYSSRAYARHWDWGKAVTRCIVRKLGLGLQRKRI